MTLGRFIDLLKQQPQDNEVRYDFGYLRPTSFHSWRGDYNHLALGWEESSDSIKVAALLERAEACVGKTFEGYKGGDFKMERYTRLWVDNYGDGGQIEIVKVSNTDLGTTILHTAMGEYA